MLARADDFLLDRVFQPLLERLGVTDRLAEVSRPIKETAAITFVVAAGWALATQDTNIGGLVAFVLFGCGFGVLGEMSHMLSMRFNPPRIGRPNQLRLTFQGLRRFSLVIVPIVMGLQVADSFVGAPKLHHTIWLVGLMLSMLGLYIVSAQPRPPVTKQQEEADRWMATNPT